MLRIGTRLLGSFASLGLPALGCGLLGTEPSPPTRPLIATLSMDFVVNHGRESVRIWNTPPGLPSIPGSLPAGRSVVDLRTSSGDAEEVLLLRFTCRDKSGARYACNWFSVGLPEGTTEEDLHPLLAPIRGRLLQLIRNGSSATVFVTEGNVFDAMRAARSWPGVRWVELAYLYFLSSSSEPAEQATEIVLHLFPLASGTAIPFDNEVQVQPGDTISVSYDGGGPELVEAQIIVE